MVVDKISGFEEFSELSQEFLINMQNNLDGFIYELGGLCKEHSTNITFSIYSELKQELEESEVKISDKAI